MSEQGFQFSLTQEEKDYLKSVVRKSLEEEFYQDIKIPEPPTQKLFEQYGAFVTFKINGQLRGCIGHLVGDKPVWETVKLMAKQAGFQDPRFPPLSREEMEKVEIEISILSPITECPDVRQVEPGRHGLVVQRGMHSGLLLPQVATEQGWDRETFLSQTCLKAGLPPDSWKNKKIDIYWFEAEVF
mgnify:FL=1